MKLIIDIPKATYDYWKEHKDEYILSEAIANAIPYDDSGDLISRKQVLDELMAHQYSPDFCKEHGIEYSINSSMVRIIVNNAPAVEYTFEEAFQKTVCEQRLYCPERLQGELANKVLELYEKYQSHLAPRVIEFGNELKDLLGEYQKGSTE